MAALARQHGKWIVTGFMGYDPEHLGWMRDAMSRTADDLARIRSDDPKAAEAVRTARRVERALVDRWLPFVDRIRGCAAMEAYVPVALPRDDLRLAGFLGLEQAGWRFLTDPAPVLTAATMSQDDAQALARTLRDGDVDELLDDEDELAWLADSLATIGADDALRTTFEASLPADSARWVELCNVLALRHLRREPDDRAVVDAVVAGTATFVDIELLDEMEPYAAALVLTQLDLDANALARTAYEITERWWIGAPPGTLWYDEPKGLDATADVVFAHVAHHPDAAVEYLWLVGEHPPILFTTAADQTHTEELLRVGLDPRRLDAARAGEIIRPLLEWVVADGHPGSPPPAGPSTRALAATMSVPWLSYFSSRAADWNWTRDEGTDALREVVTDWTALERIKEGLATCVDATIAAGIPEDRDAFVTGLDALSSSVSQLLWVFQHEALREAADLRWFVDAGVFVADWVRGFLEIHPLVNIAIDMRQPQVLEQLEEWGVIPEDLDDVRADQDAIRRGQLVVMPVALVTAMTQDLVDAGVVPADALDSLDLDVNGSDCPEGVVLERLDAFVHGLPVDDATRDAMWMAVHAFLNAPLVDLSCNR